MELLFLISLIGSLVAGFIPVVIGLSTHLWELSQPAARRLAWIEVIFGPAGLVMGFIGQEWALQPEQGEGGLISLLIAVAGWTMMAAGSLVIVPGIALLTGRPWGRKAHTAVAMLYGACFIGLSLLLGSS